MSVDVVVQVDNSGTMCPLGFCRVLTSSFGTWNALLDDVAAKTALPVVLLRTGYSTVDGAWLLRDSISF